VSDKTAHADSVNPHYLDHMMATAATHDVEASEDIVAGNGMKLLAKGARIEPAMRERLLQHKLRKPLEDCVQVTTGVVPARFGPVGEALLEQHALLAALCGSRAMPVPESLTRLRLSMPVQSLLTVYSEYQGDRLQHSVGVAMLAMALARRLLPGEVDRHRTLALAGLVHDVGELYIDPAYLRPGEKLSPQAWRHIVTHPLVGHRVLSEMEGAGPPVALPVLLHHERLDGFGYPRGAGGEQLSLDGQILGAAEWLMALIESGVAPLARASVATRLMPGEFNPVLLEEVAGAALASEEMRAAMEAARPLEEVTPRVVRIAATLNRFVQHRPWVEARIDEAHGEFKRVLESGLRRMLRIQTSFASTGLDPREPERVLRELAALKDPHVHLEMTTIVGELEWRLRELERVSQVRGALAGAAERAVMDELLGRLKGTVAANQAPPA
jgi:hypothetical protein